MKLGMITGAGYEHSGNVIVASIGIPSHVIDHIAPRLYTYDEKDVEEKLPARKVEDPRESNEIIPVPIIDTAAINPNKPVTLLFGGESLISTFLSAISRITPISHTSTIDITKIAEHISELTKNPTPFTLKIVSQSFAIPPMIPKIIIGIHNLLIFIQFSFFHRDVSLFFTRIMLSVITLRQGDIFLAVYH